ncbi:MAG: FGGY-family carbohydrate kinase [Spirochaetaceae bacterium]|jgi:sugar (pentulose or hexulose) kinase|nr:FGGY-family carbohydrate kinase [Spirochaetaceae bacterium]
MIQTVKDARGGGATFLGVEFGSTRIKAVLIDKNYNPLASGSYDWENKLLNGVWTYSLDDVWTGLQSCFRSLAQDAEARCKKPVNCLSPAAIGVSAMMHGYLVFDKEGRQLAPFRTWRNTMTEKAAAELTEKFGFNIPQRWSIAHLYHAVLNGEPHVKDIAFLTTLAGYVHWKLTGEKTLGVGDASGVFPIDSATNTYNSRMIRQFNECIKDRNFGWKLEDILPAVLSAGKRAGTLSEEGALLLDPSGGLPAGIPLCPPEGDAGTGMTATNSVAERTGNISAGTSVFAMTVLEKELSRVYTEIDMVTTPGGKPVAMVHCNSCTSDLDVWVNLFKEAAELFTPKVEKKELYDLLYFEALKGDADGGGLLSYNYYSGEPVTGLEQGRPLFARLPDSRLTLANFMRTLLYSTMAALKTGMNILLKQERVRLDRLLGHGGLFKTEGVGQRFMAAALGVPVGVMASAGEGGAWGIALLAAYMLEKGDLTLEAFLSQKVFTANSGTWLAPDEKDARGFETFMKRYMEGLAIEQAAVDHLK